MNKHKSTILTGDALNVLKEQKENSVDAIVTDPPYGISFNGLDWDRDVPGVKLWQEAFRVLKPGGHLVAFAGSRTYHRMAVNIEKAGFEVRDQIMWLYSTGFPKSYNLELGIKKKYGPQKAKKWRGWGTTLKPAHEPIVLARKPFDGATIDNVVDLGTGGLNIDGCRVVPESYDDKNVVPISRSQNRFPANVAHAGLPTLWASYFYCAKPNTEERDRGLMGFPLKSAQERVGIKKGETKFRGANGNARNVHPTVKPIALMEHLVTLVTPEGGIVLDPFAGSGTTLIAAQNLGFTYIGIEKKAAYVEIAKARLAA